MEDVSDLLIRLSSALRYSKINYVIVGGVAVNMKGRIRTTVDVDLIVENDRDSFLKFLNTLKKYNFDVDDEQSMYAIQEGFNLTVFDNSSPLRLDIKLARNYNDIQVLKKGEIHKYKNIEIKIAPIDWILFGKILYIGPLEDLNDEQILMIGDVLDFISVWEKNRNNVDEKWLTQKCDDENLLPTLQKIQGIIDKMKNN